MISFILYIIYSIIIAYSYLIKVIYIVMRASLIAQLVKNLPAMQETPVQFLGQEDPLEKGKATHPRIVA